MQSFRHARVRVPRRPPTVRRRIGTAGSRGTALLGDLGIALGGGGRRERPVLRAHGPAARREPAHEGAQVRARRTDLSSTRLVRSARGTTTRITSAWPSTPQATGVAAHTACIGFGLERVALAHHLAHGLATRHMAVRRPSPAPPDDVPEAVCTVTTVDVGTSIEERALWFGPPCGHCSDGCPLVDRESSRRGAGAAVGREARAARRAIRGAARSWPLGASSSCGSTTSGRATPGCSDTPELDVAWTDSVASAAELLRDCEWTTVSAVGMRLGATIAGTSADRDRPRLASSCSGTLATPVQLSPRAQRPRGAPSRGRPRRHRRRRRDRGVRLHAGDGRRGYPPALRLSATTRSPLADRVLCVTRDDRTIPDRLRTRLDKEQVTWLETTEQAALVDVDPLHATLPRARSARSSTGSASRPPRRPRSTAPRAGAAATVPAGAGLPMVSERAERLGESGLFGIVSEPTDGPRGPLSPSSTSRPTTTPDRRGSGSTRSSMGGTRSAVRPVRPPRRWRQPAAERRLERADVRPAWLDDMVAVATALRPSDPADPCSSGCARGRTSPSRWASRCTRAASASSTRPIGVDFLHGTYRLAARRGPPPAPWRPS